MRTPAIVGKLWRRGFTLAATARGTLWVDYREPISAEDLAEIKAAKQVILGFLRERDARLTAETVGRLRRGHVWLTANLARHMEAGPGGDSEWLAALDKWLSGEAVLRVVLGWQGCIYGRNGVCPADAPVCCAACAQSGQWRESGGQGHRFVGLTDCTDKSIPA